MIKTFHIRSLACLRTRVHVQKVHDYLVANLLRSTPNVARADLIIIDTCAFRSDREATSLGILNHCLKLKSKSSRVICIGCLAKISDKILEHRQDVSVISSHELEKLDQLLDLRIKFTSIPEPIHVKVFPGEFTESPVFITRVLKKVSARLDVDQLIETKMNEKFPGRYDICKDQSNFKFQVKVSEGCLGKCSYCAIKNVWGDLKSRPLAEIRADFEGCLKRGAKQIVLVAHDLGAYGEDINLTIVDLLRELFRFQKDYQLLLHNMNVQWLIKYAPDIINVCALNSSKIKHMMVPIQSGSNRILTLMGRPYAIENVLQVMVDLRKALPQTLIRSDIMIGFPSETDEDFEQTKNVLRILAKENIGFWLTHYSERSGTAAAAMVDKVDAMIVQSRLNKLMEVFPEHTFR